MEEHWYVEVVLVESCLLRWCIKDALLEFVEAILLLSHKSDLQR